MAKIYLVRHGKAAAGFGTHRDPGLDDFGRQQAQDVAKVLSQLAPPKLSLYSSPLARAYETAQPLADLWDVAHADITIEPRVAEIPSPTEDLAERASWLANAMQGGWDELDQPFQIWREQLHECLLALPQNCVIFSHFVAINAAVGLAQQDPRMRIFSPDNCSVTTLNNDNGQLQVEHLGQSAETFVN